MLGKTKNKNPIFPFHFSRSTYLQSQQLLAGFNVSLYLACHRLNDFNAIFIKHIEHVPNTQSCRESKNSCYRIQKAALTAQHDHLPQKRADSNTIYFQSIGSYSLQFSNPITKIQLSQFHEQWYEAATVLTYLLLAIKCLPLWGRERGKDSWKSM